MSRRIGKQIELLRNKMAMNQTQFGKLIDVSAMTVSRWERNGNMPDARSLLSLGRIAAGLGANAWEFWELAGLDREYLRSVLE